MNPYITLGVPGDADDAAIRRAYIEAVKVSPPDHHPERFQAVAAAYDKIKDQASRDAFALFDLTPPGDSPMEVACQWARAQGTLQPLPFESLKSYLRACLKT